MQRIFLFLLALISFQITAQTSSHERGTSASPYELNWALDGPWIGAGLGLTAYGTYLISEKDRLPESELATMRKDDVMAIDRWAAGNYDEELDRISYIPFYAAFGTPLLFLLGEDERNHAGHIAVLYLETMATTGALFTMTAGLVDKSRPYVYNENLPIEERTNKGAQRSFFAGHVAATGAATFFFAKVFHDFNPGHWARPYIWTAAALVPAWVGYLRIESGHHFLSDSIVGYIVGMASGILIPELHKKRDRDIQFSTSMGTDLMGRQYQGIRLSYQF